MEVRLETGGHTAAFCTEADILVPGPGVPLNQQVIRAARERACRTRRTCLGRRSVPGPGHRSDRFQWQDHGDQSHWCLAEGRRAKPFCRRQYRHPVAGVLCLSRAYDSVVLELSSFQLDLAGDFRPDIGVLLNISPDHLDRHGSLDAYTAAKLRIFSARWRMISPSSEVMIRLLPP
jgi:UDP-N-acetylmuramoylalanine--D-glutamate ligase